MKKFLFFILFSSQLSSTWALEINMPMTSKDIPTIKEHARYVLQVNEDAPTRVAVYLYAPDEHDYLCNEIGGFCTDPNDRLISGNYYLIALKDSQFPEDTTISSTLGIGEKAFALRRENNGKLKLFSPPGSADRLFTLTEDANVDGTNVQTSFFRLDEKGFLFPVKFFLKDGEEWTEIGSPEIKEGKLILWDSYAKAPPDLDYLMALPGVFDKKNMLHSLAFIYKNGNFYSDSLRMKKE